MSILAERETRTDKSIAAVANTHTHTHVDFNALVCVCVYVVVVVVVDVSSIQLWPAKRNVKELREVAVEGRLIISDKRGIKCGKGVGGERKRARIASAINISACP